MRYRPWSSVTTILANFVGRSEVSAITHTPASGPLAPVTTPAMSSPSIVVAPGVRRAPCVQAAQNNAAAAVVAAAKSAVVVIICQLLEPARSPARHGHAITYPAGGINRRRAARSGDERHSSFRPQ